MYEQRERERNREWKRGARMRERYIREAKATDELS